MPDCNRLPKTEHSGTIGCTRVPGRGCLDPVGWLQAPSPAALLGGSWDRPAGQAASWAAGLSSSIQWGLVWGLGVQQSNNSWINQLIIVRYAKTILY